MLILTKTTTLQAQRREVYTVSFYVELSNYDRTNTGDRFGGNNEIQDVVTAYTIGNDKCFKLTIDEGNYQQQALPRKLAKFLKLRWKKSYPNCR